MLKQKMMVKNTYVCIFIFSYSLLSYTTNVLCQAYYLTHSLGKIRYL